MSYYCLNCHTEFDEPAIESRLGGDMKETQDIEYIEICVCCGGLNFYNNLELIENENNRS